MAISPYAGQPAPRALLVDLTRLEREYYERCPDVADRNQLVSFGTSGHRGSPLRPHPLRERPYADSAEGKRASTVGESPSRF